MLLHAVAQLPHVDGLLSEEVTDLRWEPLTPAMQLVSAWWVKGPLFVVAALAFDLAHRRTRRWPGLALVTLLAVLAGSWLSGLAKTVFERPRPPLGDVGISAIGHLPSTSSFPSGHATTAFAAATAVAIVQRSRWLAWLVLGLAFAIALSRVYLGMHYVGDVLAGAALGAAIGTSIALLTRRFAPRLLACAPAR